VSGIIKESRESDPEFDLIREVAVILKRQGYNVGSFAPLLRCRQIFRKIEGLSDTTQGEDGEQDSRQRNQHQQQQQQEVAKGEEKIEAIMTAFEVFCFKQNLQIKEFVDLVHGLCSTADRLGVTLENLPSYVGELENEMHRLRKEVQQLKQQKQQALVDFHTTEEQLREFFLSRPFIAQNQELKEKLNAMTLERERFRAELERKKASEVFDEYEGTISEDEVEEASRQLGINLNPDKLSEIAAAVYYNPSKYIHVIKLVTQSLTH
jgi:hypothetical protein